MFLNSGFFTVVRNNTSCPLVPYWVRDIDVQKSKMLLLTGEAGIVGGILGKIGLFKHFFALVHDLPTFLCDNKA